MRPDPGPGRVNLLSFLAASTLPGLRLDLPFHGPFLASPLMTGFFTAAFWTVVCGRLFHLGPLKRSYAILAGYAIVATLVYAGLVRFRGASISPPVSFITAAFAGCAVTLALSAPVAEALAPPHALRRASGCLVIVGLPLLMAPFVYLADLPTAGIFLVASATGGFWGVLYLINAGFVARARLPARAAKTVAALLVVPEHAAIALVPALVALAG